MAGAARSPGTDITCFNECVVQRRALIGHIGTGSRQSQLATGPADLSQMFGISALEYPEINVFLCPSGCS